jgi:hypothetical protein
LTFAVMLTACPNETTIGRLTADPARYRHQEVALTGQVTNSFGLLGQGGYELSDETGRIWVITTRGVPSKGARVQTVGKVVHGFTWSGRNLGTVLEETGRRVK